MRVAVVAVLALAVAVAGCVTPEALHHPWGCGSPAMEFAWTGVTARASFPAPLDAAEAAWAFAAMGFMPTENGPWGPARTTFERPGDAPDRWETIYAAVVERWHGEWNATGMVFDTSTWIVEHRIDRNESALPEDAWGPCDAEMRDDAEALRPRFEAVLATFEALTGLRHEGDLLVHVCCGMTRTTDVVVDRIGE